MSNALRLQAAKTFDDIMINANNVKIDFFNISSFCDKVYNMLSFVIEIK